jgi:hypothetical protein
MMSDGRSREVRHSSDEAPEEPSGEPTDSVAGESGKIHFPGLNGLRFIAAFSVLLYHIQVLKAFAEVPGSFHAPFWKALGPGGVLCFFLHQRLLDHLPSA